MGNKIKTGVLALAMLGSAVLVRPADVDARGDLRCTVIAQSYSRNGISGADLDAKMARKGCFRYGGAWWVNRTFIAAD